MEPIKDHVYVYGDALDRNVSNMKAYTKFELKVDMLEVYKEAYDNIMESFED